MNLSGLQGKTAQSEGTAGTQTKGPENNTTQNQQQSGARQGEKLPEPSGDKTVKEQGNQLKGSGTEMVEGVSSSLVAKATLTRDDSDTLTHRVAEDLAIQHAADAGAGNNDEGTVYSSHPVQNYRVGRFHFQKSLLRLDSQDAAEFDKLLEKLPPTERNRVQKIDVQAAAALVNARIESQATKQFDSSVGADALSRLNKLGPTVGTTELGFENRAQQDMNAPVIPQPVVDKTGETGLDQGAHTPPEPGKDA